MKSVLTSIQPYYVFLIIARTMGWKVRQKKTVEVRKNFPKAPDWDKKTLIYCSRNSQSFKRIPKKYQPLMVPFLGKVVGEFVCYRVEKFIFGSLRCEDIKELACLTHTEMIDYFYTPEELNSKPEEDGRFSYAWHISDLKIYDKPKELGDFKSVRAVRGYHKNGEGGMKRLIHAGRVSIRYFDRPPQSWCYVEEEE